MRPSLNACKRVALDVIDVVRVHGREAFGMQTMRRVWSTDSGRDALQRRWERWKALARELELVDDHYDKTGWGNDQILLTLRPSALEWAESLLDAAEVLEELPYGVRRALRGWLPGAGAMELLCQSELSYRRLSRSNARACA